MTFSQRNHPAYGLVLDVVPRGDVEDYARGRSRSKETARRVEQALLEDDAARAIIRVALSRYVGEEGSAPSQNLLSESLQDLSTAAKSCTALAEIYDQLHADADDPAVLEFLRGRAAAFREAAESLTQPLRGQMAEIPDCWPEEATLPAAEKRSRLVLEVREEPPKAARVLADLHRPLMEGLRTLIHLPWPLQIKLLIADSYALLTEELEASAWRLKRRFRGRH